MSRSEETDPGAMRPDEPRVADDRLGEQVAVSGDGTAVLPPGSRHGLGFLEFATGRPEHRVCDLDLARVDQRPS
jgi:hypothetical protein